MPEGSPEKVRGWRALDLENEALASTGAQFSLLEGVTKIARKLSQNGVQMAPKFDFWELLGCLGGALGRQIGKKGRLKMDRKNDSKKSHAGNSGQR